MFIEILTIIILIIIIISALPIPGGIRICPQMEKRMPPSQYETPVLNQAQKDDCMKRHKILPINQLDPFLNFYGLNELTFYINISTKFH